MSKSEVPQPSESSLPANSISRLLTLRGEEDRLTEQMVQETHRLVRTAFDWKNSQGLRWQKEWETYPEGPKKTEHISYYFLAQDLDHQILLEVFGPYLPLR